MLTGAARRGEAADHELLLRAHLHLGPRAGALTGQVGRGRVLADDPFQIAPSRLGERLQAVGGQAAGDPQHRPLDDLRLQRGAAGRQRLPREVPPTGVQAIEDDVDRCGGPGRTALEELKARDAAGVEDDDLAVEDERGRGQRGHRRGDVREVAGAVLVVAGEQAHARALLQRDEADAVVLLLPHPAGTVEGRVHQRREHGRDAGRTRAGAGTTRCGGRRGAGRRRPRAPAGAAWRRRRARSRPSSAARPPRENASG